MTLATTLVMVTGLLGAADGPGWEPAGIHQGVKVETRQRAGSEVVEVRAVAALDAPPDAVFRVITDLARYPQTMPHVSQTRLLKEEGDGVKHWYLVVDPPVVSKRDYAIRMVTRQTPEVRRAEWTISPLAPPVTEGKVRITVSEGHWVVEPRADGKTQVTYYLFVDPAGRIPKFLANKANRDAIPDVLRSVERHARQLGSQAP